MELESTETVLGPVEDRRPKMEEPPPVRLLAVADCRLSAAAGLESSLDKFYVGLLRFERHEDPTVIRYRAENGELHFVVTEVRQAPPDFRSLGICVPSLPQLALKLAEAEIEYDHQRGLLPGQESFILTDPAENLLEITEIKTVI